MALICYRPSYFDTYGEWTMSTTLFKLGRVVATPGALAMDVNFNPYILMHANGYWGDLNQEDWIENDLSVKSGYRILSAYDTPAGCFWIITEANRSATTILLPCEY